jgi:hypothetical protein
LFCHQYLYLVKARGKFIRFLQKTRIFWQDSLFTVLLELFNFTVKETVERRFMTKTFALYIFIVCILPVSIFGQTATFTVDHEYQANRNYTFNAAQEAAMQEAQADLLRQLGVLVEAQQRSATRTIDGNLQQDLFVEEAITYTLGRVQTVVVEERFQRWSEFVYSAIFKMEVDTVDLFAHLNNIARRREQARADSIAQAERARIERGAREQRVGNLESALQAARNSFEQEEQNERSLRMERSRIEQELQSAQKDRENAQRTFNSAQSANNAHTPIGLEAIQSAARILQNAENNYNRISVDFKNIQEDLRQAERNVERSRNNVNTAENNLSRETGVPITPLFRRHEVRSQISGRGTVKVATNSEIHNVSDKGITINEGRYKFLFEPKNNRWELRNAQLDSRQISIRNNSVYLDIDSEKTINAFFSRTHTSLQNRRDFGASTLIISGGAVAIGGLVMFIVGTQEVTRKKFVSETHFGITVDYYKNVTEIRSEGLFWSGIGVMGIGTLMFWGGGRINDFW